MHLDLAFCFAICTVVRGLPEIPRPESRDDLRDAISDLQLLIPLLMQDSLAREPAPTPTPTPTSTPTHRDRAYPAHSVYPAFRARASPSPMRELTERHTRHDAADSHGASDSQLKYSENNERNDYALDGPFSDIPDEAFQLEDRREEFQSERKLYKFEPERFKFEPNEYKTEKKNVEKDLNGTKAHKHIINSEENATHAPRLHDDEVPDDSLDACLAYFRGRLQPEPSAAAVELIVHICNELLDATGVGDFEADTDDAKPRTEGNASVECECCPDGHRHGARDIHVRSRAAAADDALASLARLASLFKPIGTRRDWTVLNSKNTDDKLKQYVDLKKESLFIV